jgi:hypothetical protein
VAIIPLRSGVWPVACRAFRLCWASVDWAAGLCPFGCNFWPPAGPPSHHLSPQPRELAAPTQAALILL